MGVLHSLVMPLLAPFAREYGFSPLQIGLLIAGYPMAQLVAGPILGRLSDRFGRRPVLAASQFGVRSIRNSPAVARLASRRADGS